MGRSKRNRNQDESGGHSGGWQRNSKRDAEAARRCRVFSGGVIRRCAPHPSLALGAALKGVLLGALRLVPRVMLGTTVARHFGVQTWPDGQVCVVDAT
jgi:hypothetical protein